jgi:hypothetical protein
VTPRGLVLASAARRALPLPSLAGGMLAACVIAATVGPATLGVQLAGLALAGALAATLDDPARATLGSVPVPLRTRRALALALAAGAMGGCWAAVLWLSGTGAAWAGPLTLQAVALCAVAGALATAGEPATAGAAVALTFVTARVMFPAWTLGGGPAAPHWAAAQTLWAAVALIAAAALACASRDPARRPRRARGGAP